MGKIGDWVRRLFEEYKLVRRVLIGWSMLEVHLTLAAYRANIGNVEGADATIIVSAIGLIGTVLGAGYLWTRDKDDARVLDFVGSSENKGRRVEDIV